MNCEQLLNSIQVVPYEINLRKEKWLAILICRSVSPINFCTVVGGFNMEFNTEFGNAIRKHFLDGNGLYDLVKEKASLSVRVL